MRVSEPVGDQGELEGGDSYFTDMMGPGGLAGEVAKCNERLASQTDSDGPLTNAEAREILEYNGFKQNVAELSESCDDMPRRKHFELFISQSTGDMTLWARHPKTDCLGDLTGLTRTELLAWIKGAA